jgi:hypothetical protein
VLAAYGQLPLSFEPNQGQSDPRVKFLARGSGYTLFLTATAAVLALQQTPTTNRQPAAVPRQSLAPHPQSLSTLRMQLVGANPQPQVTGREPLRRAEPL